MSTTIFEAEVTEFNCIPAEDAMFTIFKIHDYSMTIEVCDENKNLICESEISIEDAKKLARLILL